MTDTERKAQLKWSDEQRVERWNQEQRDINKYRDNIVSEQTVKQHREWHYDFRKVWQRISAPYARFGAKEHIVELRDLPRPGTERYVVPPSWRDRKGERPDPERFYQIKGCKYRLDCPDSEPGAGLYVADDGDVFYEHSQAPHPHSRSRTINNAILEPECCAGAVWDILALLDRKLPEYPHYVLAYQVIRLAQQGNAAVPTEHRNALAAELAKRAGELRTHLDIRTPVQRNGLQGVDGAGVLILDRALAAYLSSSCFDNIGRGFADSFICRVQNNLQSRQGNLVGNDPALAWRGWLNTGPTKPGSEPTSTWSTALNYFGLVLWNAVVEPRLKAEQKRASKKQPALPYGEFQDVTRLFERDTKARIDNKQTSLLDRFRSTVAVFDPSLIASAPVADAARLGTILARLPKIMQTPYGPRALAWTIRGTQLQEFEGARDWRVLRVLGGREAHALEIGASRGRRVADLVLQVFTALGMVRNFGAAGQGRLIDLSVIPNAPGRPRQTVVTALPILSPGQVFNHAGRDRATLDARRLIPVVDLKLIPVDPRHRSAGLEAQILLTALCTPAELREYPTEMTRKGGAPINPYELAKRSGLSPKQADHAIGIFVDGVEDRPPFLVCKPGNLWTLADAHRGARDFLENALAVAEKKGKKNRRRKPRK